MAYVGYSSQKSPFREENRDIREENRDIANIDNCRMSVSVLGHLSIFAMSPFSCPNGGAWRPSPNETDSQRKQPGSEGGQDQLCSMPGQPYNPRLRFASSRDTVVVCLARDSSRAISLGFARVRAISRSKSSTATRRNSLPSAIRTTMSSARA
jgi:hypothetical protein